MDGFLIFLIVASVAGGVAAISLTRRDRQRGVRAADGSAVQFEVPAERPLVDISHNWGGTPGVLELSRDVRLTLKGEPAAVAEVEAFLRTMPSQRGGYAERLAMLQARLNVECPEVEAFRAKVVKAADKAGRDAVRIADPDLEQKDPTAFEELVEEASNDAFDTLDERPGDWIPLEHLRIERPTNLDTDDYLMERLGHERALVTALGYFGGAHDRAFAVERNEWLQPMIQLCERGFAVRGPDIPLDKLAASYALKDLNEALRPPKPIRRKAQAAEAMTPEVAARLPKVSLRFYIAPLGDKLEEALLAYAWAPTHARLIVTTVRTALESAGTVADREAGDGWQIMGECCKRARDAELAEPTKRRPARMPPFHIGCGATVDRTWV